MWNAFNHGHIQDDVEHVVMRLNGLKEKYGTHYFLGWRPMDMR